MTERATERADAERRTGVGAPNAGAPSTTAVGVAWLRAAHQVLDARPLILDDPVALAPIGPNAAVRQYLVLVAGLDTFAYRAAAAGIVEPEGVTYAAVDFLMPAAAARYYAGRTDGLPAPRRTAIGVAVV